MLERRIRPLVAEVLEADPFAVQAARSRVREAEPDRQGERSADEREHEDDRRCDERGRKDTLALEDVRPAPRPRPCGGNSLHANAILTRVCAAAMAEITLEKLTKVYGDGTRAVSDLDLEIDDGEFVVLVGPSGCGKTSALRMIAGLEPITEGRVVIGGEVVNNLPPKDRDIAMIFQNYALYQIGRASCRERVEIWVVAGAVEIKRTGL